MNTKTPSLIFSVCTGSSNDDYNHNMILSHIDDCSGVLGVYQGQLEESIFMPWSEEAETMVQGICADFNQQCYLMTDANGYGYLHAPDGTLMQSLGKYVMSKTKPVNEDYTQFANGYYLTFGG